MAKKLDSDLVIEKRTKTIVKSENTVESEHFCSGSTTYDTMIGGNKGVFGYRFGRIYNIVGDSSSGKSFLAAESIASARKKYGNKLKWNYDDGETGFTFDTKNLYGFEIVPKETLRSKTVEDAYINVNNFIDSLKEDEYGIYIIDSLDGLTSKQIQEIGEKRISVAKKGKEFDEGSYKTEKAKFLSQEFFPDLAGKLDNSNCALLIVSQIRDKIGVTFGKKADRTGGKALNFYAHSCVWLSVVEKLKKKEKVVGIRVKAKTEKSKTPRPFRESYTTIFFDIGVDNISGNLDYLFNLLTDMGKESAKRINISWDGKDFTNKECLIS